MSRLKLVSLTLAFSFALISCSDDKSSSSLYFITFDDLAGFTHHSSIKTVNYAYSGNKCVQLNKEFIYGPTFSMKIADLRPGPINRLILKGRVRIETEKGKMQIVCSIDSADKTIYWNAIDSRTHDLKPGEWKEISSTFDLSKVNDKENKINIYPMHDGEGNTFIDNLEFSFE